MDGEWIHIATRSDGASVYRVEGRHAFYVKTAPPREPGDLRFRPSDEAERLRYLADRGFPVPEVVELGGDDTLTWLVTTALPGVTADSRWTPDEQGSVLRGVADLLAALHDAPLADCPFDGTLAHTLVWAQAAARTGLVDEDDLDESRQGWTAERLLAELHATPAPPEDDLVLCHGDPCLDNVLVDPDTLAPTGFIDVGRFGIADRWRDLAVLLRNLGGENEQWLVEDDRHVARFLRRYDVEYDERKAAFYRLLDEFF
ncbi:APH(3') family aminoglycoside O-phosphotransferase [Actinoalloteichus hymeniacidonis]|uniref:APH(3') family aminoglycoside O-phosphotransferase n=1 Tax=Actinoalloteichus hymeniacidonis TaxID=340345 RepID=UPI000852F425